MSQYPDMPELRKQFCKDVAGALRVYNDHHDYELKEEQTKLQQDAEAEFKEAGRSAEAAYVYYRKMNTLLRELSGAGIEEPIGTGDTQADYQRAMSTIR